MVLVVLDSGLTGSETTCGVQVVHTTHYAYSLVYRNLDDSFHRGRACQTVCSLFHYLLLRSYFQHCV